MMREFEDLALSNHTLTTLLPPTSEDVKHGYVDDLEGTDLRRRKSLTKFLEESMSLEQYYQEDQDEADQVLPTDLHGFQLKDGDEISGCKLRRSSHLKLSKGHIRNGFGNILTAEKSNGNANYIGNVEIAEFEGKDEDADLAAVHDEFDLTGMMHCCAGQKRLLRVEQMPDHLQFNKFVHSGYRDIQNAGDCFMSLFYLHNETVNIFTHVAPIFAVIYYWRSMYPWDDIQGHTYLNFLGWSHVIGSISPWLGSVVYHLFMNHSHGPKFYKFLLQMDMFGIWVAQCFGAMTNLTASTWCLSDVVQMTWMGIYGIASIWGLHKALTARSALGRRMCFALVFISRLFGFALRISKYGGGDPSVLTHVILQDVVSVVGGFIGVFRIPELWFPGKLDMFFNSHHIMHVMVVLAVFHMNLATNGDIRWILDNYSKSQCVTLF